MVISNTTPLNYLILIGRVELLATLYGEVVIPPAVHQELTSAAAPAVVKAWFARKPEWLRIELVALPVNAPLHPGESQAIALAQKLQADALIIDDLDGRKEAVRRGIRIIGTLRVLFDAAGKNLCDLPEAYEALRHTSFRTSATVMGHFLELDSARRRTNHDAQ